MHSSPKLIYQLGLSLKKQLTNFCLFDAFSANKNELILVFNQAETYFSIKLIIEANQFFFQFYDYPIERKGSTYLLFQSINKKQLTDINLHQNERSFRLVFSPEFSLIFKLYGSLANVILFKNHEPVEFFRPQITNDKNLSLENFLTYESESKTNELLQNFTLKIPENSQLCELVVLESNQTGNQEFSNIFEAYNEFTKQFLGKYLFLKKKEELLKNCNSELKRWTAAQKNAEIALNHLKNNNRNEEIGHIIMANLHLIEKGTTLFVTNDFYTNQTIEIKLKENLNPQQNAAYYYKKARNQHTEEQLLANKMVLAAQKIEQNELKLVKLQQALKMNDLKSFFSAKTSQVKNQQIEQTEKHKEFNFKEFKILVGKSAANNDELTLKIAHKNDLWLHAKGVSGSHVIIKHQQKEFSKEVIIYAAQLAAYYSKAKGSVLVPVIYCLKKFVRKPKGANPGQVIVEKEELIMVEPKLANI